MDRSHTMSDGTKIGFYPSSTETPHGLLSVVGQRDATIYTQWMTETQCREFATFIARQLPVSDQMIESVMAIAKDRHDRQGDFAVKAVLMNQAISGKSTEIGRISGRLGSHARICIGPPSVSVCYTVSWEQIARAYFFDEPVEINN